MSGVYNIVHIIIPNHHKQSSDCYINFIKLRRVNAEVLCLPKSRDDRELTLDAKRVDTLAELHGKYLLT